MKNLDNYTIAIVAAEDSADNLGAPLIKTIISKYPNINIIGIGGPKMINAGLKKIFEKDDILAIGITEIIWKLPTILKIRKQLLKKLLDIKPDIYIGIDLPDFNLNIEKFLHQNNIKTIHYVSPSIWAWRQNRIHNIIKANNLILCLFPFEVDLYKKANGNAVFIGHPLAKTYPITANTTEARQSLNLTQNDTIFTILPGSREMEIKNMGGIFFKTIKKIQNIIPNAIFLIPIANSKIKQLIEQLMGNVITNNSSIRLIDNNLRNAITAANIVLATSGTVTLEVALCKKPMVISYKVSSLTYAIVKSLYKLPYVGLPNILLKKMMVPELLQKEANPTNLTTSLMNLLNDKNKHQEINIAFTRLHQSLLQDTDKIILDKISELLNYNLDSIQE